MNTNIERQKISLEGTKKLSYTSDLVNLERTFLILYIEEGRKNTLTIKIFIAVFQDDLTHHFIN